jgi:hypothetical protein
MADETVPLGIVAELDSNAVVEGHWAQVLRASRVAAVIFSRC